MPKLKKLYDLKKRLYGPTGNLIYSSQDDLYAWYKFDQDISLEGNLVDSSGNGRNLSPKTESDRPLAPSLDSPKSWPGFPKKSTEFDNDLLINDNENDFVLSSGFTMSAWVKFDELSGDSKVIAAQTSDNIGSDDLSFKLLYRDLSGNKQIVATVNDSNNSSALLATSAGVITLNTWHHVVITYDGLNNVGSLKIYVDGNFSQLSSTVDENFVSMNSAAGSRFCLGNYLNFFLGTDFGGKMSEFAVWSKDFSAEDVLGLYNASSHSSLLKSGYLTNPSRTKLIDLDNREGQYPKSSVQSIVNSKKEKPEYAFDDNASIDFGTAFPTAQIEFVSVPRDGEKIKILIDNSMKTFEIQRGDTASAGTTLVNLKNIAGLDFRDLGGNREDRSRRLRESYTDLGFYDFPPNTSPREIYKKKIAIMAKRIRDSLIEIAKVINGESSLSKENGISIKAEARDNFIILKSLVPYDGQNALPEVTFEKSNFSELDIFNYASGKVINNFEHKLGTDGRVILGSMIRENSDASKFSIIDSPNKLPNIKTNKSELRKGLTDAHYFISPENNHEAFDDSLVHIDDSDDFYADGTPFSVTPGFSSPLKSKTQIVIQGKRSDEKESIIFFSTGSTLGKIPGGKRPSINAGSGIAYWSPIDGNWDMLGNLSDPSSFDPYKSTNFRSAAGVLAFTPDNGSGQFSKDSISKKTNVGQPIVELGFPLTKQYNAKNNNCINMSDYITEDFLLEKISVEISGSFGLTELRGPLAGMHPIIQKQFFILNQFTDGDKPHHTGEKLEYSPKLGPKWLENELSGFDQVAGSNSDFSDFNLHTKYAKSYLDPTSFDVDIMSFAQSNQQNPVVPGLCTISNFSFSSGNSETPALLGTNSDFNTVIPNLQLGDWTSVYTDIEGLQELIEVGSMSTLIGNNAITRVNNVELETEAFSTCLNGNSSGYIKISDEPRYFFPSDGEFSLSVWVYHNPGAPEDFGIVAKRTHTPIHTNREWIFWHRGGGGYIFRRFDESINARKGRELKFNDHNISQGWHHFLITDGPLSGASANDDIIFYVDGVQYLPATTDDSENGNFENSEDLTGDLLIGSYSNSNTMVAGFKIADVALFNRVVTQNEAKSIYNHGRLVNPNRVIYPKPLATFRYGNGASEIKTSDIENYNLDLANLKVSELTSIDFANDGGPNSGSNRFTAAEDLYNVVGEISTRQTITVDNQTVQISLLNQFAGVSNNPNDPGGIAFNDPVPGVDPGTGNSPIAKIEMVKELTSTGEVSTFHADIIEAVRMVDNLLVTVSNIEIDNKADTETKFQATHSDSEPLRARVYGIRTEPIKNLGKVSRGPLGSAGSVSESYRMSIKVPAVLTSNGFGQTYTIRFLYHDRAGFAHENPGDSSSALVIQGDDIVSAYNSLPSDQKSAPGQIFVSLVHSYDNNKDSTGDTSKFHPEDLANRVARAINGPALNKKLGGKYEELGQIGIIYGPTDSEVGGADNFGLGTSYLNSLAATPSDSVVASARAVLEAEESNLAAAQVRRDIERAVYDHADTQLTAAEGDGDAYNVAEYTSDLRFRPGAVVNGEDVSQVLLAVLDFIDKHNRRQHFPVNEAGQFVDGDNNVQVNQENPDHVQLNDDGELATAAHVKAKEARDAADAAYNAQLNVVNEAQVLLDNLLANPPQQTSQNADHAAFMKLEGLPNGGGIPPLLAISKGSKLFIYTVHANGIAYDLTTSRSSPGELISNIDLEATKDFLEYPSPNFKQTPLNQATIRISVDDQNNQESTTNFTGTLFLNGGTAKTDTNNANPPFTIQGDLTRFFDGSYDGIFKGGNTVSFLKDKSKVLTYKVLRDIGGYKDGNNLIFRAYIDVEFQPEKSVGAEPFSIPEPTIKIDMGSSNTTGTGVFNGLPINPSNQNKDTVIKNILGKNRTCFVGNGSTTLKVLETNAVELSFSDEQGLSVSAWVYHDADNIPATFGIVAKGQSTNDREWQFYFDNPKQSYVFRRIQESADNEGGTADSWQGRRYPIAGNMTNTGWYHFFITDGPLDAGSANDDIRIFVNGQLATGPKSISYNSPTGTYNKSQDLSGPIIIGSIDGGDVITSNNMISDISIWNQELSAQSATGVYHDQLSNDIPGFYQRVLSEQLDSRTTRLEILPGEKVTSIKKNILVFSSGSFDILSGAPLDNKVSYFVDDIKVFDDSDPATLVSSNIVPTNQQAFLDLVYMDSESSGLRVVKPNENTVTTKSFIELPIEADVMVSEYPPLFYTGPKHGSAGRDGNAITLEVFGNNGGELYGDRVLTLATTQQFFGNEKFIESERIKFASGSDDMNHAAPSVVFPESEAVMNTVKFLGNDGFQNSPRKSTTAIADILSKLNLISDTEKISISAIFSLEGELQDNKHYNIVNLAKNDPNRDTFSLGIFKPEGKDPCLFFSITFTKAASDDVSITFLTSFSLTEESSSHNERVRRDNDDIVKGKFYHACISYDSTSVDHPDHVESPGTYLTKPNLPVITVDGKEYGVTSISSSAQINSIEQLINHDFTGYSIPSDADRFCLANSLDGSKEFYGRLGESLVWCTGLSVENMKKLNSYYRGTLNPEFTSEGYRELVGFAKIGFTPNNSILFTDLSENVIDPENKFLGDVFDKIVAVNPSKFTNPNNEEIFSESSHIGKINFNFEPTISTVSNFTSIMPLRSTKGVVISTHEQAEESDGISLPAKYKDNSNALSPSPDSGILSNPFGGASGTSSPSGRQIVSSIINTKFTLEDSLIATQFSSFGQNEDVFGEIFSRQKESRESQRKTSPYLLKPSDRLVFGWQNHSFNPTEDIPGLTNSTVESATESVLGEHMFDFIESIKVTLFGSNVSARKETQGGTKENLTSNSIHQVIGDEPVLDQFDTSNIELLSGSYTDALMFGTMIKKSEDGKPITGIRGRRGSLASHHGGPTGSLQRTVRHSQTDLVYADTQLPYFGQIIATLFPSASTTRTGSVTLESDVDYGTGLVFSDANPAATAKRNITWPNIYSATLLNIIEQENQRNSDLVRALENAIDPLYLPIVGFHYSPPITLVQPDAPGNFNVVIEETSVPGFETPKAPAGRGNPGMGGPFGGEFGGFNGARPFSDPTLVGIFPQSDADFLVVDFNNPERKAKRMPDLNGVISRLGSADANNLLAAPMFRQFTTQEHLFGVKNFSNDEFTTTGSAEPLSITATEESKIALSKFAFGIASGRQKILYSGIPAIPVSSSFFVPQPRGFKYGVMNTPPLRPFNVYRRDSYGQFRDMLEQHPETHFNRDSGRSKVFPSVIINFVSRDGESRIDPESTNTQNLSIFATSSLPYADGDIGIDRITTQPDLLDQVDVILEADSIMDE